MYKLKADKLVEVLNDADISLDLKEKLLKEISSSNEMNDILKRELPYWEFIYGLSLICGLLSNMKKEILDLIGDDKTINSLYLSKK